MIPYRFDSCARISRREGYMGLLKKLLKMMLKMMIQGKLTCLLLKMMLISNMRSYEDLPMDSPVFFWKIDSVEVKGFDLVHIKNSKSCRATANFKCYEK